MGVKAIAIRGFKSFAERALLEFHLGVTAIVGPNGCGKSNIVDAFRWVVGEQSAKSLRGGKMQDIIFAGTSSRKPLNSAEVSLTFDNEDGFLPTPFREVVITRRMQRDGTSEYMINGKEVRLRDVQSLFFDSGIGKEAFTIFEQGKIEQVILWSPAERRSLFEEAAGIVRFLQRQKESLQKLEQANMNLSRASDIHKEVSGRLELLERQSGQALRYREIQAESESLEKAIILSRWQQQQQQLSLKHAEIQKIDASILQQKCLFDQAESYHALIVRDSEVKQETIKQVRGALQAHKEEQALKRKDLSYNLERKKDFEKRRSAIEQELIRHEEMCLSFNNELQKLKVQYGQLEAEVKEKRHRAQGARDKLGQAHERQEGLNRERQEKKRLFISLSEKYRSHEVALKQLQQRENAYNEQLAALESNAQRSQRQLEAAQENAKCKGDELAVLAIELDAERHKLDDLEVSLTTKKKQLEDQRFVREELRRKETEINARIKALEELRASMAGLSHGAKKLLKASQDSTSPLYGRLKPLYELIVLDDRSLMASMERYGHTLVVENGEDLAQALAFWRQERSGAISLLCREACEGTTLEDHFKRYFNTVPSWEKGLCKSEGPRELWLEEEELFCDHHGVLFTTHKSEGNAFMREALLTELHNEAKLLVISYRGALELCKVLQQEYDEAQHERHNLEKAMRQKEMKHVEVNHSLLRWQEEQRRCQHDQDEFSLQRQRLESSMAELTLKLAEQQALFTACQQAYLQACDEESLAEKAVEEAHSTLHSLQRSCDQQEKEMRAAIAMEKQCAHSLEVTAIKLDEASQRKIRLCGEVDAIKGDLTLLEQQHAALQETLELIDSEGIKLIQQLKYLEDEAAAINNKGLAAHTKIKTLNTVLKELETNHQRISLQLTQQGAAQEALEKQFFERFNLWPSKCEISDVDIAFAEKRLKAFKNELANAGDINFAAIDECVREKERYQHLTAQVSDLTAAKQQLVDILHDLEKQCLKRFQEAFDAIRANFKKNFSILFEGGEADLVLIDGGNPLVSGIEIVAKPPGKQLRAISLLSGGEKCLTAMALLFAIFEYRPAPYCLLDEIDAPLDDANVGRFTQMLRQFSAHCQFIIVTHNKHTMAMADRIYGVSQDCGVSKLLSLEFAPDDAVAVQCV